MCLTFVEILCLDWIIYDVQTTLSVELTTRHGAARARAGFQRARDVVVQMTMAAHVAEVLNLVAARFRRQRY